MKVNITLQIKGVSTTFYYINAISPAENNKSIIYSGGHTFECDNSYEELFLKLRRENENNK